MIVWGWSPGTDEEVMSRDELIEKFSLDRVLRKSAIFDPTKLEWLSGQHLALIPPEALLERVLSELGAEREEAERWVAEDRGWFLGLIDLLKARARTPRDIAEHARIFLGGTVELEPEAVRKHWEDPETVGVLLSELAERLREIGRAHV